MSYSASGPNEIVKVKYDATVDPTSGNDETEGYSIGSRWVNTTTPEEFVALGVGTGSAAWTSTTGGGGGGGLGQWDYVTGGAAPAVTKITANTDLMSTVTTINLADSSGTDNDFSAAFGAVRAGDYLVFRDNAGGAAYGSFLVTAAPVDNTTYWTFTVSTGDVSGSFTDTNTYDFNIISDGNVVGPATSTDNRLARYDGTTGKLLQDSAVALGDDGNITWESGATDAKLEMYERATPPSLSAGYGKVWVENTVPTRLVVTGDTGVTTVVVHVLSTEPNGNNIVKWDGALGQVKNCADMGYSGGKLDISGTTASLQIKERNTGPTGTANNGLIWIRDDAVQTLMFTDDADVDKPIVTGPASATDNAIVRFDGATGNIVQQATNLFYTDAGQIQLNAASAAVRMKERTSGPTGSASQGLFWVKDDVPTAPMFTDDTDVVHRLNKELDITLVSNELIQLDQTEVVIGGGYLDGGTGGTFSWEALATQIDGGGGVLLLTSEIRLYDMGPDGTPTAGTLRSSLEFPTDDSLDRVSLALTASASPGTDTDTIQDAPRMYEVRAYLDSTGGNVDSLSVLNVKFVES